MIKLLFIGLLLSSPAFAVSVDFTKCQQDIKFEAVGNPSALKIVGTDITKKGLVGKMEKVGDNYSGEAIFNLNTLDTGIDLRNKHMKEKYLQVNSFSSARLTYPGKEFSLHGVTRKVNPELSVNGGKISAKFAIDLNDYNIKIPSFMEITVAKTVNISVDLDCPLQ